ncbi:MAG TPA: PepSY domain-containing protein [Bryobacteraceae bacterium]
MRSNERKENWWQEWLRQPQRTRLHGAVFQLHFWIGTMVGMYVTLLSVTGSIVVFENELAQWGPMRWLVKLHQSPCRIDGPRRKWYWRRLPDHALLDRSDHLVARHQVLAAEHVGELAVELSALQLGFA